MTSHPQTCRCSLHRQIEQRLIDARRHECYRQLANAILGPDAPRSDLALARALADRARLLRTADIQLPVQRAA